MTAKTRISKALAIPGKRKRGRTEDGALNPIDRHVGARVRQRRMLLGMSLEKLGEAIGLTYQQVQKYERGANRISASRLFDMARVLDVPVSFFFDDMDEDDRSPAAMVNGNVVSLQRDWMESREMLEFGRDLSRLSPHLRSHVRALVRSMAVFCDQTQPVLAAAE